MNQSWPKLFTIILWGLITTAITSSTEASVTVPIERISFAGSGSLPFTTATFVVPDKNTTRNAGGGLRRYDAHIAKMFELTAYWCGVNTKQPRDTNFQVDWNYEADSGRIFMGRITISCLKSKQIFLTYGVGKSEQIQIEYRGNPQTINVSTLNLNNSQKITHFRKFVQTLNPQCLEAPKICPGDRLN